MSITPTASAKERVLAWVREKNPNTKELKDGCIVRYVFPRGQIHMQGMFLGNINYGNDDLWSLRVLNCVMPIPNKKHFQNTVEILGTDMGLQELLIAICSLGVHTKMGDWNAQGTTNGFLAFYSDGGEAMFNYDLAQNLHNQSEEFYESLLPLLK